MRVVGWWAGWVEDGLVSTYLPYLPYLPYPSRLLISFQLTTFHHASR